MTRHERVLTALRKGRSDRPPIAFDCRPGVEERLLHHYGAADRLDLYRRAGVDGFSVWHDAVMGRCRLPAGRAGNGSELDFWGSQSQHQFGLAGLDTVAQLRDHRWPAATDFDFSHVAGHAARIRAEDQVVAAGHIGLGYQMHAMLRGNEASLTDLFDDAWMSTYLAQLTGFTLAYLEALLTAGQGRIEVVRADDDVGNMERLTISPAMWRQWYKPAWRAAFELCHRHGALVWLHSCGHIRPLLEDLVEIGVDCWDPFPGYVRGNDPAWLRDWHRGKLALMGGVNHFVLVSGSPQDVAVETQRVLDTFAPDGGLVIGPSQVFTEDVPTANIAALFETVLRRE